MFWSLKKKKCAEIRVLNNNIYPCIFQESKTNELDREPNLFSQNQIFIFIKNNNKNNKKIKNKIRNLLQQNTVHKQDNFKNNKRSYFNTSGKYIQKSVTHLFRRNGSCYFSYIFW